MIVQGLSGIEKGRNYPFVAKRTFRLTMDNPGATSNEVFWGIQVIYTAVHASPPLVLVQSVDENNYVNPIYAGLNGGVYAVSGRGIASEGEDCYGNSYTVPDVVSGDKLAFENFKSWIVEEGGRLFRKLRRFVSHEINEEGIKAFNFEEIKGKKVLLVAPGYIVIALGGDITGGDQAVRYDT